MIQQSVPYLRCNKYFLSMFWYFAVKLDDHEIYMLLVSNKLTINFDVILQVIH